MCAHDSERIRINSGMPIAAKDSAASWVTSESVSVRSATTSINSVVTALSARRGECPGGRCSRFHSPVVPCLSQSWPVIVRRRNNCWQWASHVRSKIVLDTIEMARWGRSIHTEDLHCQTVHGCYRA